MGEVIEFKKPEKKDSSEKAKEEVNFDSTIEANKKRKEKVEQERRRKNDAVKKQFNVNPNKK